ncbi:type I addiction module toxin, SymE family [Pantoea dispersa]|nr:type I toxin-antitoxin system SymE family toxin [Pantoea dispersa]RVU76648.1 type I addiction module toxin, SymE family [Pantoea dispersa]
MVHLIFHVYRLREVGFESGQPVTVRVEVGCLILTAGG